VKSKPPSKQVPRPSPSDAGAIGSVLCARVAELRKKRRWTLAEMSAASGVSRSMLNDIERGRANPTLAVAHRIALAFGMSLVDLIEMPAAAPRLEVIRANDHTYHFRSDRRCKVRTLSPLSLQKDVEFYEIVLGRGGALRRAAHFHGTRELLTVQQGTVRLSAADESAELKAGDSIYYPADVEHSIENLGQSDAVLYQVVTYSRE
jgi:transcriptional regulator with XRE-family HTH domain